METAAAVDAVRFPRVAAYLARLPAGMRSFPECQAKGTLLRPLLEDLPLSGVTSGLPPELLEAIRLPPPQSSWIPEVLLGAMNLAAADHHRLPDEAFLKRKYDQNMRLFNGFVYRLLMSLSSPLVLLELGTSRWGQIHRGTTLRLETTGATTARVHMEYPARLYDRLLAELAARVFQAALDHSHARLGKVRVATFDEQRALFEATWS